jgi:hypothetical protein
LLEHGIDVDLARRCHAAAMTYHVDQLASKRSLRFAVAVLAVAGALALSGCGPRADRAGSPSGQTQPDQSQSGQNPPGQNQPAPGQTPADTTKVDTDLSDVNGLLGDVDSGLSAVDKTPEDSD